MTFLPLDFITLHRKVLLLLKRDSFMTPISLECQIKALAPSRNYGAPQAKCSNASDPPTSAKNANTLAPAVI